MITEDPLTTDVQRAKKAVWLDDDTDDELAKLFPPSNDPSKFSGTAQELSDIRSAMKRYEEREAGIGEDKAYYDSRFRLQFVETV